MRQPYVTYSEEVARRICDGWAAGEPMTVICRGREMPHPRTVVQTWLRERADFRAMFEEARERRLELFAREPGLEKRAKGHLGRRSGYDEEMAARICARIAAGASLRALAQDVEMPTTQTIYNWLAERQDFRTAFKAACDVRTDGWIEEALEIADDDSGDLIERPDGRLVGNPQAVSRARVQVEARRWAARLTQTRTDWMDGRMEAAAKAQASAEDEEELCYEDILDELLRQEAEAKARAAGQAPPEGGEN